MNKYKKPVFLVTYGLLLYFFLLRLEFFSSFIGNFISLITPFIWGFALAYILNIPYQFFLTKLFHADVQKRSYRTKQTLSLVLSYVLFFLVIGLFFALLIPQLNDSINIFIANSNNYTVTLQNFMTGLVERLKLEPSIWREIENTLSSLTDMLMSFFKNSLPSLLGFITATASSLINILATLFISMYFLASKESLMSLVSRSVNAFASPKVKMHLKHILEVTNQTFRGFIIGQLTDAFIIGLITFICSSIFQFPYPILLGFLAGVTNVIPVVGPLIGAVPCVLIILMVQPAKALWYIIFITILQQIDGNVICPKIVGDSTGLDGLWILFAVIVGGGFFGIVGCLLAVPVCAIALKLYEELLSKKLAPSAPVSRQETAPTQNSERRRRPNNQNTRTH